MTADEIIQRAYKLAKGDDENLSQGEMEYSKHLGTLDMLQKDWAAEKHLLPDERWASLERVVSVGAEEAKNGAIKLPETASGLARLPINGLGVCTTTGIGNMRRIIKTLRGMSQREFAEKGENSAVYTYDYVNKQIFVKDKTVQELQKNSERKLSFTYYKIPNKITSGRDVTEVDEPNWLVYMLGAEIARTDIIQSGQYGNLIAMAQNVMIGMISRQRKLRIEQQQVDRRRRYA